MKHDYSIPYAFQMYGRITVTASSKEEAVELAKEELSAMSVASMISNADYLSDSEEIDSDGPILEDGQAMYD